MSTITVGVIKERTPGERRVAMVPDAVGRLCSAGVAVVVEAGAGASAWFDDDAYAAAGAAVVSGAELLERADVVVCVRPPDGSFAASLRSGRMLIGMLEPQGRPDLVRTLADRGVTALSLDQLPRTLSRAQSMDALTSQANIAGYKAAVLAANAYGAYFPMLTTAAGTMKPAAVLILGTGVAGLQAIGTARRLGAIVSAYDIRPESKEEVESLGARFLDITAVRSGSGAGGYARALSEDEQEAQQRELDGHIARSDIVITTARVPGRRPPVLVTCDALKGMRPGSVVVDMASDELGGNVEGSLPDTTLVTENGVTVIGAANLPSDMAPAASTTYARNVGALLAYLLKDGVPVIDRTDEVQAGVVITMGGAVVNPEIARLLDPAMKDPAAGDPAAGDAATATDTDTATGDAA